MKHSLLTLLLAASAVAMTGCASVMNDTNQAIKVETLSPTGQVVLNADCVVSNDYGQDKMKSGDMVRVHRSNKDLAIVCKAVGQADATGRAISRANGGLWGNIIIGGGLGAVIDHNKGTAYTYPTWMQLVFGQALVFDRSAEKEGSPTPAHTEDGKTIAVNAPSVATPIPQKQTPPAAQVATPVPTVQNVAPPTIKAAPPPPAAAPSQASKPQVQSCGILATIETGRDQNARVCEY